MQAGPQAPLRPSGTAVLAPNPLLSAVPLPSATLPAASPEKQLATRVLPDVGRASAGPLLGGVPVPAALPPSPTPEPAIAQLPRLAAVATLSAPQQALAATPAAAAAAPIPPLQNLARPDLALPVSTASAIAGPVASPLSAVASTAGQGAPDAGSRVGADVATLPSTAASAPKRLNLELPRLRGGELSRYSTTGLLPALPRPPEVPDKLGSAIEKTAKEDCRKAYAGAGLLAVVPLAVDALREGGCKW